MEYVVFYSNKKSEDIIMLKNRFNNCIELNLDYINVNIEIIKKSIEKNSINTIIFFGLESGWNELIIYLRKNHKNIKIEVINNTSEARLYCDYERNNFFKLLELSRKNLIDCIAFLKHGKYELYKKLGYKCCYLMQNYKLEVPVEGIQSNRHENINIGIYPLNYTWDKNIFNQFCIGKFIENSNIYFNNLDGRMQEFLNVMNINNTPINIKNTAEDIILKLKNIDICVSCDFTNYFNPIFFISMELGIPCLLANTTDLFEENDKIKKYIITKAEDNPIENAKQVKEMLKNKNEIMEIYRNWKKQYDKKYERNIQEFISK